MKRFLTLITIVAAYTVSAHAQEIANGYYRMQNGSGKYATMINRKIDEANYNKVTSGGGGSVNSIRMKPLNEIISDPGAIIKITNSSAGLILEGQDANTYNMTGLYLQSKTGTSAGITSPAGAYWLYGSKAGATRYLFDGGTSKFDYEKGVKYSYLYCVGLDVDASYTRSSNLSNWYFKKLDNNEQYFGITPDVPLNGKYYTTLYCNFPFQVTGDMKVYYVTNVSANNEVAKINEITSGIVPAKTPVIIECTSKNPADNKVNVGVTTTATYSTSLKGEFYSYVMERSNGNELDINTNTSAKELRNAVSYVSTRMRMLGVSNGKLALVKPSNDQLHTTNSGANKYIPANKAYLDLVGAANIIILDDGTSGINSVQQEAQKSAVFNLQGQKIAEPDTSVDDLPRGIYIINGKKIIKD